MVTRWPGKVLLGRRVECDVLDRLLAAAVGGQSGVLVLVGEPGIGKSALLDYATESASSFRVVKATGVEWEMELPFATAQQMCAPLLDGVGQLPDQQREALGVAFGLTSGEAPDRFLVGLAVLNLLSAAARQQPLLCVVDDAQWLDRASAQTFAFVARRLLAERVAFVFAAREPSDELQGLPQLVVTGLSDHDARRVLMSPLCIPVDERVRARIVAETRGNPLALLEIPRGLTAAKLASGFGFSDTQTVRDQIEESFQRQLAELPAETRRLLLVAAAEPVGDPKLMWRAAEQLGLGDDAADAAESEGLLNVGARVTFRHPLLRSVVYRTAASRERQRVHRALAEATDPAVDPDRRAWHRAQSTRGSDEEVARELERSAGRAQSRGGFAAAAAFLERAASLTPDPLRGAERALAAAQATFQAGALDASLALLATAESGALDEFRLAQADVLRAQIAFATNRGSDVPPLLLTAARRLEPLDSKLAREIYLDAMDAVVFAGRLAKGGGVLEVAEAIRATPAPSDPDSASDLFLDGFALLISEGHRSGAPILKRALSEARRAGAAAEEPPRWLVTACTTCGLLWDYESWDALSDRLVRLARKAGALSALPIGLNTRAGACLLGGDPSAAASLVEEAGTINAATGSIIAPYGELAMLAFEGREADASELIAVTTKEVLHRGEGNALTFVQWATAVLHNGLARYGDALAAAQHAAGDSNSSWFCNWGLVELIEAAARSGEPGSAADALSRLSEVTTASATDWGLGVEARSRALLAEGELAESLYREALERLARTRVRIDLARAHLLYGEWLRRERRRLDAREQLRRAHTMFTEFRMSAFAERARVELEATGEHPRQRTDSTRDELTPQETQISRLAADGATNQEIAARLFISPSTVDYHLRKSFRKLGVRSRTQLARHVVGPSGTL